LAFLVIAQSYPSHPSVIYSHTLVIPLSSLVCQNVKTPTNSQTHPDDAPGAHSLSTPAPPRVFLAMQTLPADKKKSISLR